MGARDLLGARLGALGPTQATVSGAYAWAITVAPVAWARGSTGVSQGAALAALAALAGGAVAARKWGDRARVASLWGFILACALAWSAAPGGQVPLWHDLFRGLAGTLAWALFAFTWAAPARSTPLAPAATDTEEEPLVPRRRLAGREGYVLLVAGMLALALQAIGWDVPGVERTLLVRVATLAAGLALLDASAQVAVGQYPRSQRARPGVRLRRARTWLAALGVLGLVGAIYAAKG